MKLLKLSLVFFAILFTTQFAQAQNSKYVGTWTLTDFKGGDKCGKDQSITLRKNGSATYNYAANTKGCKPQIMQYKVWNVGMQEFRTKKGKIKKQVLTIGKYEDIKFIIMSKKGKIMTVSADVPSGDTTTKKMMKFKKS